MIGWDAQGHFESDDLADQVRQALHNVVRGAGRGRREARAHRAHDLVRHRQARVPGRAREIGAVYRDVIGSFTMAMTAVQVAALIEDRAKVEIEVTAVVPD